MFVAYTCTVHALCIYQHQANTRLTQDKMKDNHN